MLAIVIVFILLYLFAWSSLNKEIPDFKVDKGILNKIGWVVLILSLIQIILGTQVRENMDEVIRILGYEARGEWIEQLGTKFYIHRSFSIVVFGANVLWFFRINRSVTERGILRQIISSCLVVLGAEILTGILMAYFGVPPFAQPLHLTMAILLIGLQFVLWLIMNSDRYLSKANYQAREELV